LLELPSVRIEVEAESLSRAEDLIERISWIEETPQEKAVQRWRML